MTDMIAQNASNAWETPNHVNTEANTESVEKIIKKVLISSFLTYKHCNENNEKNV